MRFFLISDNSDAMNGMRLAGIEGVVARSAGDVQAALDSLAGQTDLGLVLVTEKIAEQYEPLLNAARKSTGPLVITVPSTGGGTAGKDRITRYVREAIGVKI